MEALTLLLMVLVVPGYPYVLQPSLTVTDIVGPDSETDSWSEWRLGRLRETPMSEGEEGNEREGEQAATIHTAEKNEEEEWRADRGLTPETGYERGIIENGKTAVEITSEEGLTPETVDPGKERGEDGLRVGFTKNGDMGETVDNDGGDEKIIRYEGETPETGKGEEDWIAANAEDGLIGGSLEEDKGKDVGKGREDGGGSPDVSSGKAEKAGKSGAVGEIRTDYAEDGGIEGTADGQKPSVEEDRRDGQTDAEAVKRDKVEVEKQWREREEEESELVAGIGPLEKNREEGEQEEEEDEREQFRGKKEEEIKSSMQNKKENIKGEKRVDEVAENAGNTQLEEREGEDHTDITSLTPLTGTAPPPVEEGIATPATLQDITPSRVPPTAPPPVQDHNVFPTPPISLPLDPTMSPSRVPSSFTDANLEPLLTVSLPTPEPTNQAWALTVSYTLVPDVEKGKSVSLVEDDLIELLNVNGSPRHRLKEKEDLASEVLEIKVGPTAKVSLVRRKDDVNVKLKKMKPVAKEVETTHKIKGTNHLYNQNETNSTAKLPKLTIKTKKTNTIIPPKETTLKLVTQDEKSTPTPKQSKPTPKSKESNSTAKLVKPTPKSKVPQPTDKPKQGKSTGNETKPAVKQYKVNTTEPQATRSTANPLLTRPTAKTAEVKPSKINKNKKSKKKDKTKGKKGRKSNKTKKPTEKKKKEVTTPADFPYFKDNYCPPECACYGRVVQCSDKGVDRIPYGIPYNARYILLMNNRIDRIQLDLLNEYLSMEFLVLSNNQLTDGSIEGAFEGVPALKRLYLDRNLLESVPTDLPASLEELRLDNNHLSVMSEAAWPRCPGLLVLSLRNNSLGNGSQSLPSGVLSPLGNLRTLSLDYNQFESVPLGLPLSIKELYLRGNHIKRFRGGAFNGTSELVVLDLSANRLTNKGLLRESLLNATHLESLNLEGNRLKQVPRHLPPSLKTLNLEGNLISSISKATFNALSNLEHLGLARNRISRVAPGAFRTLSVLHQLDLCHNSLRQVPRQLPRALYSAALTHNRIQSVPRDAFCWGETAPSLSSLVRVQLEHNLIDLGHLDAQAFRCLRGFQVVHFY